MTRALIVVDVQNDFCEGGALAVSGGNEVAHEIGYHLLHHGDQYDEIILTADWHYAWPQTNGGHFSENPDYVNTWPVHCQARTPGAMFHPFIQGEIMSLEEERRGKWDRSTHIFRKGLGWPDYSGFQGHNSGRQSLHEFLHKAGVKSVDVVGIAGDYCVLQTALDAKRFGYNTRILPSMVASVGGPSATQEAEYALANA